MDTNIETPSSFGTATFVILLLVVAYLVYDTYWNKDLDWVLSSVDNRRYLVQNLPDKQEAANLLAHIRKRLNTIVEHLVKTEPSDERVQRMQKNYKSEKLSEGIPNAKYTSYSINKGEKIVFCLRSRDEKKALVDLNTMMFVALHELSHICTESIGHTDEFWDNFRWILEIALNIGIYQDRDYKNAPQAYCGITITDSPLHNQDEKSDAKKA